MTSNLNLEAVIGFEGKIKDGMKYIWREDGEYLIYALGSTVVVKNIADNTQSFMQGHTNEVSCIAVSNDGKYAASGQENKGQPGMDAVALIWDLDAVIANANTDNTEGEKKHTLKLHKGKVQSLAFSCDGTYISSLGGQDDNSLVVWRVSDGEAICGTSAHTDSAKTMCWYNTTEDRLVTCGNYHLKVWEFSLENRKLFGHQAKMGNIQRVHTCVALPDDDSCIYSGTTTGEVLQISNRELIHNNDLVLEPRYLSAAGTRFKCGVMCLSMVPNDDGSFDCLVGSGEGTITRIRSWRDSNKRGRNPAQRMMGCVTSVAVRTSDPSVCFLGTAHGNTYLCETSCTAEAELRGTCHYNGINDVCFPGDCSDLFLTCSANDIRIWNAASRQELLRIQVPNLVCNCIHVTQNGGTIVSGWDDGKVRGFQPESGALKFVVQDAHNESCTAIKCFNEEDSYGEWHMASGGMDGRVRIWKILPGKQKMIASLKEHRDEISGIQIVKDNSVCMTSSKDGSCICWDLVNFTRLKAMFANTQFSDIKLHPDESQMLTCGTDRKITYWDTQDADAIRVTEGSDPGTTGGSVTSIDIVGDGEIFVSGSVDRLVKLWHYDEGEVIAEGAGHSGDISAVRISPDGQKIVTVGKEGAIFVWSVPQSAYQGE